MATDDMRPDQKEGPYEGTRISTGHDLVDKTLQGGIPLGSVCLVEGPSGSGKGVFCQHLVFGALMADLLVVYYVSRGTADILKKQLADLGQDVSMDTDSEQLRIYTFDDIAPSKKDDAKGFLSALESHMRERIVEGVDVVIIDDLTRVVTQAGAGPSVNFFEECKAASRRGLTIISAIHTSAFDHKLLWRFQRLFDAHVSLSLESQSMGTNRSIMNLMEVKKVENTALTKKNTLYFKVNTELATSMNISLEVVPIFKVQV
jgi:archaeal flagellar protein FlaH